MSRCGPQSFDGDLRSLLSPAVTTFVFLVGPPQQRSIMNPNGNLERILQSSVFISWAELTRGSRMGLIQIEYGFTAGGTLEFLRIWSSLTRGRWLLTCEYWMSADRFHSAGIRFHNGYRSEVLKHNLEVAMQHQNSFVLPPNLGRQGLLQISEPTLEENAAATALLVDVSAA